MECTGTGVLRVLLRALLSLLNLTGIPRLVFRLVLDRRVPLRLKLLLLAAVAYIISPIDLVPDILLPLGRIDDIVVALLAIALFLALAPRDVVMEHVRGRRGSPGPNRRSEQEIPGETVSEVVYGLMSEADKVRELTKLVGKLQMAVRGSDGKLMREAEEDINGLSKHLPSSHNIPRLIKVAKSSEGRGPQLLELYLQRSYHLVQEQYAKLNEVDKQIKELEIDSRPE